MTASRLPPPATPTIAASLRDNVRNRITVFVACHYPTTESSSYILSVCNNYYNSTDSYTAVVRLVM